MNVVKTYRFRTTLIFFLFCLLYGTIIVKLYLIQVKYHDFYTTLGQKQYNITLTQYPPRAPIYDRNGNLLALNKETISAFILPKSLESAAPLKAFLKKYFSHAYERLQENNQSYFMYIKRRLSDEHIKLIQESGLTDIKFLKEPSRYYPIPSAAQTVGITDIDNQGLFGIELQNNSLLAGTPSTYTLEKDARSGHFYFQKETKVQGSVGQPVTVTLDSDLQFIVDEELKEIISKHNAKEGSAIVINPTTGEILAMTNYPSFDPNATENLSDLEITKNKIITEVHELGSVIKTFAALSALEAGVVTLDELIDCENKKTTYFEHRKINTVAQSVAGIIPFVDVVVKSNNIGIAKVAKRLGPSLYDYYHRLGFGTKTGIAFPGEQKGFLNHPDNWSKQSLISLSYGYEVSLSLLQLARAFSIIANDGFDVQPYLFLNAPTENKKAKRLFKQSSICAIKEILKKRHKQTEDYILMSKTGTANVLVNGIYNPNLNIFTCAGIIEKGSYKRVIVVFINEVPQKNVYAATIAAPLLERIAKKLLIHDKCI